MEIHRSRRQLPILLGLAWLALFPAEVLAQGAEVPSLQARLAGRSLFLEVFVNGTDTELIAEFQEEAGDQLSIDPQQLTNVGIAPADDAFGANGRVILERLPGVSYRYDEATQSIYFVSGEAGLAARLLDAGARTVQPTVREAPVASGFGALMNYSLVASSGDGDFDEIWSLNGLSGFLEPRIYTPYGVFNQTFIASTDDMAFVDTVRLESSWSYSDVETMRAYRIGDIITGGLSWTRPTRLGGIQIQRNFGLRPDLVTFPIPSFSGSAAVPSTVDVYVNNARQYSSDVPAGPFRIENLPIVSGRGTAQVVVRDAQGQEVVTRSAFFASSQLLAPGLLDYSAELGFARRHFGTRSNDYDQRPMGSATLRYGLNDDWTLEAHAEGGEGLANGGAGAVFGLGTFGVGSLSGAGSTSDEGTGFQVAGQAELTFGDVALNLRSQRSFGDYNDIASVTAEGDWLDGIGLRGSAGPPRALDQATLSFPLVFDPSFLNVSLTNYEDDDGERSRILGLSYSRTFRKNSTFFASGFTALGEDDFGVFAGVSLSLTPRLTATGSGSTDSDGAIGGIELARSESQTIGDYSWRLRAKGGERTQSSAAGSYLTRAARFDAELEEYDGSFRATARAEGAVVAAGGSVYLANRIDDAFAVVDVGAPNVEVSYENRPVGKTRSDGRILVPGLRSNEDNNLSFDPTNLPLDAVVNTTRQKVRPASRSGLVVTFGAEPDAKAALVVFETPDGEPLVAGSAGQMKSGESFVVGYDGTAYIANLSHENAAVISAPDGGRCVAEFADTSSNDIQATISDVVCRPETQERIP